jgi:hypothetical protein
MIPRVGATKTGWQYSVGEDKWWNSGQMNEMMSFAAYAFHKASNRNGMHQHMFFLFCTF